MSARLPTVGRVARPLAEINVTPLVDVMLVLLVIFMVTAPMLQQGLDVELPETTTQPVRLREEPLVVTVRRDGSVFLARQRVPLEKLRGRLEAIFEGRERREVFLRADRRAPYGLVVRALAAVRAAGVTRVGIVTEPERGRGR